ncbi:MAG: alpha/beta hydrolase fold domain-containing protein, partial [Ilumatobacteraceae bacterium]|nr:alpha/beta hydrolase fold domain-containing protein [Ilumatobacteraceae bacterium]
CQDVQDGKVSPAQMAAETARCTAAIMAAQHDSQAVVRWARANAAAYRIDPTRIAAMGSSAGAVTAVHLAQRGEDAGDVGDNDSFDSRVSAGMAMSGCNYDPASIDASDAPVSLLHAEYDGAVPFKCAIDTAAMTRARGVDARTILYYGESTHAVSLYVKDQSEVDAQWTEFLIKHLNLSNRVAPGSYTEIHGLPNRSAVVSITATSGEGVGFVQALPCGDASGSTSNLNIDIAGQTRAGLAIVRFDATGSACLYNSFPTHLIVDLQGYLSDDAFDDNADRRLVDTRSGVKPSAGSTTRIHGTPNRSAVVSLVATGTAAGGWVQALPCSDTPGASSNLNTDAAGQTRAGLAIVRFDAAGSACLYTSAATHLLADLQGYLADAAFSDVRDLRLLDTRSAARAAAGSTTVIRGAANSSAFLSLVSTQAVGPGWLAVLPCDATPGATSNLNVDRAGLSIAGAAVLQFDAAGEACVYTSVSTHVIVDLQGYFTIGSFDDIADVRALDTRP